MTALYHFPSEWSALTSSPTSKSWLAAEALFSRGACCSAGLDVPTSPPSLCSSSNFLMLSAASPSFLKSAQAILKVPSPLSFSTVALYHLPSEYSAVTLSPVSKPAGVAWPSLGSSPSSEGLFLFWPLEGSSSESPSRKVAFHIMSSISASAPSAAPSPTSLPSSAFCTSPLAISAGVPGAAAFAASPGVEGMGCVRSAGVLGTGPFDGSPGVVGAPGSGVTGAPLAAPPNGVLG
mmetsp:Transcript_145751/g.363448  ORF Transcript_145751/g.363448 Transcript_145751/m.363448 type:complete len:235 (-) Transcript_145751:137-841(-)